MSISPVQTSFPGVYVKEVPSGVRTISGVATSITAFVGRALRGPVDEPVTLQSFGDFERVFGGLWAQSHLGYSVRDFFRMGGGTAIVVRVHTTRVVDEDGDGTPDPAVAPDGIAQLTVGAGSAKGMRFYASSPGSWGSRLRVRVDVRTADPDDATLFNLTVTDQGTGVVETHRNVSFDPTRSRRVDLVLRGSRLVRMDEVASLPTERLTDDPAVDFASAAPELTGDDGGPITAAALVGDEGAKRGIYALEKVDLFNLLVVPPYDGTGPVGERDVDAAVVTDALAYVEKRRAVLVLDPPMEWSDRAAAVTGAAAIGGDHSAVYFPRIKQPDELREGQVATFAPSGAVAGLIAKTDAERGVWKSPAGLETALRGVSALSVPLTDLEIGDLNQLGVNCLRMAPGQGHVVWGARTRDGADRKASEWKYLAVRRTALFIEESLFRGLQWAVFEPNDEPLYAQVRLNVGAFMNTLFRQGAFQGKSPKEAYFVKCDRETTTQNDVNLGVVNIAVGFAPLKPAEFVVLRLQQMAGQINV